MADTLYWIRAVAGRNLFERLALPVIAAPMFLVSGPALVEAACRAGIVGALPAANARNNSRSSMAGSPSSPPPRWRAPASRASAPGP